MINDIINNLKIEKMDHLAQGIGYFNNKIVFVEGAFKDEIVDAKIKNEKAHAIFARVINFIKKNPKREELNELEEKYYLAGFPYIAIDRMEEIKYKNDMVKEVLNNVVESSKIRDIVFNNDFEYRNKITIKKDKKNNIGIIQRGSNKIIPIDKLLFVNKNVEKVFENLKEKFKNSSSNELVIRSEALDFNDYTNESVQNYSYYLDEKNFKNEIVIPLLDMNFYVNINGFFQINKKMFEKILEHIQEYAKGSKNVLDLYCGVGSIGLSISKFVNRVDLCEINDSCIKMAKKNILKNNIQNAKIQKCDLDKEIIDTSDYDLVIVDPPRRGIQRKLLERIDSKKLIYLSCNLATLKRDLQILKEKYKIEEVIPFDMFLRTEHVETVVLMSRAD